MVCNQCVRSSVRDQGVGSGVSWQILATRTIGSIADRKPHTLIRNGQAGVEPIPDAAEVIHGRVASLGENARR